MERPVQKISHPAERENEENSRLSIARMHISRNIERTTSIIQRYGEALL